jgi:hypothetical protein
MTIVNNNDYIMKTNIVKSSDNKFVKLNRVPRSSDSSIYNVDPYSVFKLVDALSNGDILYYIECEVMSNTYEIGIRNSLVKMSSYLLQRLSSDHRRAIFGNVKLECIDDFNRYFGTCEFYTVKNSEYQLRKYIDDNFNFDGKSFKRKMTSHYINV